MYVEITCFSRVRAPERESEALALHLCGLILNTRLFVQNVQQTLPIHRHIHGTI